MQNSAPNWRMTMQQLQRASTGEDLKERLIFAINVCRASHMTNTDSSGAIYDELLFWDPVEGGPALPPGWFVDDDHKYKKIPNQGG